MRSHSAVCSGTLCPERHSRSPEPSSSGTTSSPILGNHNWKIPATTHLLDHTFESALSMNQTFRDLAESLESKHQALLRMESGRFWSLPKQIPERGIYLFSEEIKHLYVGRPNGIRKRLQNHCRLVGTHFTATLAFRIARVFAAILGALGAVGATTDACAPLLSARRLASLERIRCHIEIRPLSPSMETRTCPTIV